VGDAEGECAAEVLGEEVTAADGDGAAVGAVFDEGDAEVLVERLGLGLGVG